MWDDFKLTISIWQLLFCFDHMTLSGTCRNAPCDLGAPLPGAEPHPGPRPRLLLRLGRGFISLGLGGDEELDAAVVLQREGGQQLLQPLLLGVGGRVQVAGPQHPQLTQRQGQLWLRHLAPGDDNLIVRPVERSFYCLKIQKTFSSRLPTFHVLRK